MEFFESAITLVSRELQTNDRLLIEFVTNESVLDSENTDLRFSLALCDEEKQFRSERRKRCMNAMNACFGDEAELTSPMKVRNSGANMESKSTMPLHKVHTYNNFGVTC